MIDRLEKIMTFDIESNHWTKFCVGAAFDGHEYWEFDSIKEFVDRITKGKKYNDFWIYAHNGGRFDFLFILNEILRYRWKCSIMERSGSVICIKIDTGKIRFQFRDSYALLPSSLKELTKVFKVEHEKGEFVFKPGKIIKRNDKKLLKYLRSDVLGLYEVLQIFFTSEFVVKPQLTLASQTMHTWRNKFLSANVTLPVLFEDEEERIRNLHYAGGRVEVYKGQGKNIRIYDINSLYPYAMLEPMPCGEPEEVTTYQKGKIGFYEVRISGMPDLYISPLLCRKDRGNGYFENYYTNGDGVYYCSSATIEYIKKEFDASVRVIKGFVFPNKENIFDKFVTTYYKIKSENKGNALSYIAKIFLNSLYGKFGQSRFKEEVVTYTKDLKDFVSFDDYYGLMIVLKESHSKFILPYLASYITELARLIHFKYMHIDPQACYYCDTDSIFTTSKKYDKFVGPEIGKLKDLGSFDGIFLAPKTYALRDTETGEEIITFKGFDPKEFSYRDFQRAIKGQLILRSSEKDKPMSFKECNRFEKARENSRLNVIREDGRYLKVSRSSKELRPLYKRRQVIAPHDQYIFDTWPLNNKEV